MGQTMTTLFSRIKTEIETNPDGWTSVEKAQSLAALIVGIRASSICEIGVWSGRSLITMAMALQFLGQGKVIGIDPWSKEASIKGMDGENLKWWSEVDHEMIFQRFQKRLADSGAAAFTEIHRCTTYDFLIASLPELDLLHLDGNHSDDASCWDVFYYGGRVRLGGFLFMDDIEWAKKATESLSNLGFQPLYHLDTGALFQRTTLKV